MANISGQVLEELAELDYRHKGKLYVFREVPAGVCQQCGEKYLTARTAKQIEREMSTQPRWTETITVPLIMFEDAAAV